MHLYEWKKVLKTKMYYLRMWPAVQAIQFTFDQSLLKDVKKAALNEKASLLVSVDRKIRTASAVGVNTPSLSLLAVRISVRHDASITVKQEPITLPLLSRSTGLISPLPQNSFEISAADLVFSSRNIEESNSLENNEACLMCSY